MVTSAESTESVHCAEKKYQNLGELTNGHERKRKAYNKTQALGTSNECTDPYP